MTNDKVVKTIGIVATVLGIGVSLVSSWVSEKKVDAMITDKVAKEVAKLSEK